MISPSPLAGTLSLAGRYQIQRKLGAGSTGAVYVVEDQTTGRVVALKVIGATRIGPEGLELLQREFRALAGLRHPSIAEAYDFGYTDQGLPFYTRQYVPGSPLSPGPPGGGVSPGDFLRPLLDLLEALDYLHAHEILHLDVHAGNVIETEAGRGVLIDFGLMRPAALAIAPVLLATAPFLPPELLRGEAVRATADLYSVGRVLLRRLTGSYTGDTKLSQEIPGWGTRTTLELERIAARALHSDPERRFASAGAFHEALSRALGGTLRAPESAEPGASTIGRDPELAAIEAAIARATEGASSCLWFAGPAGVGKTRLITEARWRAQVRGLGVVEVRFHDHPAGEPLLVTALRSGRGRALPAWLQAVDPSYGGTTMERAARAAAACLDEKSGPLVLLLDDVERSDRESRLLVRALLGELSRRARQGIGGRAVAMVATSASVPAEMVPAALHRSVRRLRPLPLEHSRRLLADLVRPLNLPARPLAEIARRAHGFPSMVRRLARVVRQTMRRSATVTPEILRAVAAEAGAGGGALSRARDPELSKVVHALAVSRRPAGLDELAAGAGIPRQAVEKALRRLQRDEIVECRRAGGRREYCFTRPETTLSVLEGMTAAERRRLHARTIAFLRSVSSPDIASMESLARHLLAAGRRREARETVLETVGKLRESGRIENAIRLLTEAAACDKSRAWRLAFLEEISSLHEEAGDHREGIAVLEPLYRGELGRLDGSLAIRIRRRLAVHYHRAGDAERALLLFEEVKALAGRALGEKRSVTTSPATGAVEELVVVESELAELFTVRGMYPEAEEACRKGFELLAGTPGLSDEFRARMEVLLRGSLGHLELRRMRLETAQRELQRAAALAKSSATAATRALILNNLGTVHNHLNDFDRSRECYARASRILRRGGEKREALVLESNLAIIAAKTGDAEQARSHLEKAATILSSHRGRRLEFTLEMAAGVVAHLLGDPVAAMERLERAIPLARKLGDSQSMIFASAYLAEAEVACGLHYRGWRRLRSLAARTRRSGVAALERMVHSRLLLIEGLLARQEGFERSYQALQRLPRAEGLLLESWNDVFLGLGSLIVGDPHGASAPLEEALRTFRRLGIPAGFRLARVGLLAAKLRRGDTARLQALARDIEEADRGHEHRLLAVFEPLAVAESALALGDGDRAERCLGAAVDAMIGLPLLELDWRTEFLRARLAERRGDQDAARHHVRRSLSTRDLIAHSMPARWRRQFLEHPRFLALERLHERLERAARTPRAAPTPRTGPFHGMVGRSSAMLEVFRDVERLGRQEIPVLITGETGTGKELVARAIHQESPRHRGPFMAIHCASLPAELFESELFGYEAGAFTGAVETRRGLLDNLEGGTLLLDEVAAMAPETQLKLLRVLDSRTVRPLGSVETRLIDVRFLAASTQDLDAMVARGECRAELYYRLAGATIAVPPLRARREDIADLVRHFTGLHAQRLGFPLPTLTREALEVLEELDWPGNVRQLEATVVRLLMQGASPVRVIAAAEVRKALPETAGGRYFTRDVVAGRRLRDLRDDLDRVYLQHLHDETGGDLRAMALELGVNRATLYRWFKRLGLDLRGRRPRET